MKTAFLSETLLMKSLARRERRRNENVLILTIINAN